MLNALKSEQPLILYVDIKSPYAFVAVRQSFALQKELRIEFDWRPLTLDIPSYLGSARKKKGKVVQSKRSPQQWNFVRYAYRDCRRYAERQGYMLKGTEKIWDSSIANIGILWVRQKAPEKLQDYFAAVYPAFWRRELDIENPSVVEACLRDAGVSADGFTDYQNHEGRNIHDDLQAQLHEHGIYGVPSYVFDDEIFFGREHLPFIRWYFNGKKGAPPDIAYEL